MPTTLSISLNKDTEKTRILNGFVYYHGYEDNIVDPEDNTKTIPNPETKTQFAKRKIAEFVKESVKAYEVDKGIKATRDTKIASADKLDIT